MEPSIVPQPQPTITPTGAQTGGRKKLYILLTLALVVVAVSLYGIYSWQQSKVASLETQNKKLTAQNQQLKEKMPSNTKKTDTPSSTPTPTAATPVTTGTIKGMPSYPSENLPPDEEVCAQDSKNATSAPICVNVGQTQALEYTLTVPAGTYHVYAKTAKWPNYKAYYNEYSKCGNSVNCPDAGHKQYIDVKVAAGAVVTGVDPGDWYAN